MVGHVLHLAARVGCVWWQCRCVPYLNSTMDYINNNHNIRLCRILINNDNLNLGRKETSFIDIYEPNPDCRYVVRNLAET